MNILVRWCVVLLLLAGSAVVGQTALADVPALQAAALCPTPAAGVPQDGQFKAHDGHPARTVRLGYLPGTALGSDPGQHLEGGRICVAGGVVIPDATDCPAAAPGTPTPCTYQQSDGDFYALYSDPATIYLEAGQLNIKRIDTDTTGTLLYLETQATGGLEGALVRTVAAGETISLKIGEVVFIQDATIRIWNPDPNNTATILSVGVNDYQPPTGCGGVNCWIPS